MHSVDKYKEWYENGQNAWKSGVSCDPSQFTSDRHLQDQWVKGWIQEENAERRRRKESPINPSYFGVGL